MYTVMGIHLMGERDKNLFFGWCERKYPFSLGMENFTHLVYPFINCKSGIHITQ